MVPQANLLPQSYVSRLETRRTIRAWLIAIAVAVWAFVLVLAYVERKVGHFEARVKPLRAEAQRMADSMETLGKIVGELRRAQESETEAFERQSELRVLATQPFWSGILANAADAAGERLWLTSLELRKREPRVFEGVAESAPSLWLSVEGGAESSSDVVDYVTRLSQSPNLYAFELDASTALRAADDIPLVEFKASGKVK